MRKVTGGIILATGLIALNLISCGEETVLAVCNDLSSELPTCQEYGAGFTTETARIQCNSLGYTFDTSSTNCSRTNVVGTCTVQSTEDGATRRIYYYSPLTTEHMRTYCESLADSGLVTTSFSALSSAE